MTADLVVATENGVTTITLNRPARKNAFTLPMIDAWVEALRGAGTDETVRTIVVTGAGGAFCSGIDLSALDEVPDTPIARKRMLTDRIHQVAYTIDAIDKPVIAAVSGVAVGAGMDMALLCDMRIAARSARFSEGYIKVGLVPGDGGSWLLPRLIGSAKAMELLLTGDFVSADDALRLGLVNHVVDDSDLLDRTYALCARIAAGPPVQVGMIRRLVRQSERVDLRTHFDLVSSHFGVASALADYAEASRAFREGRPGSYEGR